MKRYLALFLSFCLLMALLPFGAFAEFQSDDIIYLEDGSYISISIEEAQTKASGTRTGSKTYNHYNSADELLWKAVLTGTFTYNGTSAACTASSSAVTIYDSSFFEVSKTATKSGNTAYTTVSIGRKFLGITVAKNDYSISLSCDKNGVLS